MPQDHPSLRRRILALAALQAAGVLAIALVALSVIGSAPESAGSAPVVVTLGLVVPITAVLGAVALARGLDRGTRAIRRAVSQSAATLDEERFTPVDLPDDAPAELVDVAATINELGRELVLSLGRRRAAEVEAREAGQAALLAAQQRTQFLANVSHEIRTPLNGVIGMTGLLFDTKLDDTQREFAETIRTSGEALLSLINDILDHSRIDADSLQLDVADFAVRGVVEEAVDLVAPQARRKAIELSCEVAPEADRIVRGDPGRVRQVLVNLLGNAVKFTHAGEVTLSVTAEGGDADGRSLCFRVSDTGIGIRPDQIDGLFLPFVQADGGTTRRYGGTGLGLAIVKRLIELMNGTIDVTSRPGIGSTFRCRIPLPDAVGAPGTEAASGRSRRLALEGRRVLVVDDNATNRRILRAQLRGAGADVVTAESAKEALEVLQDAAGSGSPFEAAVLDCQMPEVDGLELARRIQADPRLAGLRTCLLTSIAIRAEQAGLADAGIGAWLTKPVRQSRLVETLDRLLSTGDVWPRPRAGVETPAGALPARPTDGERIRGLRVLVVEDNPSNQLVAQHMLRKAGCRFDVVANGREAVQALDRGGYDVVLMDCQMPEMDGYTATRVVRARELDGARTPIIALTANALAGDRERCLEAGMDDYLTKPVRLDALVQTIARWTADVGRARF